MQIEVIKDSEDLKGKSGRVIYPIPFSGDLEIRPLTRDLEALVQDRITFDEYRSRYLKRLRISYMSYPVWWDRVLKSEKLYIATSGGETNLVEIPHALMLKEVIESIMVKRK